MLMPIDDERNNLHSVEFPESFDPNSRPLYDNKAISDAIATLLTSVGEDPSRPGLAGTPQRVARMYQELFDGYRQDLQRLINGAIFEAESRGMVTVKDIEFFSLCEHHLLPFSGKVHVAYIPGKWIIGLSKIPRIVDMFARRLQIQERLTQQIAECLNNVLEPMGVAVRVEGAHFCATMRGVKQSNTKMITDTMLGVFHENSHTRSEFFSSVACTSHK